MSNPSCKFEHHAHATWYSLLLSAGARGKKAALDELIKFLNNHESDLLRGQQTISQTLGVWINDNSRYALREHIIALGIKLQKNDTVFLPRHSTKDDPRAGMDKRDSVSRIQHQRRDLCRKPLLTEVVPPVSTIVAPRHTFLPHP